MRSSPNAIGMAIVALCATAGAWGATIYDGGGPASPLGGPELTVHQVAAGFTLAQTTTVTSFDFWSIDFSAPFPGYAGSLGWWIYADNGGTPGQQRAAGTATGFARQVVGNEDVVGNPVTLLRNSVGIGSFALDAGSYWLGLKNGPAGLSNFNGFLWAETAPLGTFSLGGSRTASATGGWTPSGLSLAFQIGGNAETVVGTPEPGTGALLMAGLGAAWLFARRKR